MKPFKFCFQFQLAPLHHGELNIHPPGSVVSNATFNVSLIQYCQLDDGTTEYFFSAQITGWDIVPGVFGIPLGLVEGTFVRQGNAGEFKSWKAGASGYCPPRLRTPTCIAFVTLVS